MGTRTGFNDVLASDAIDVVIGGGADVRLFTSALAYDDNAADLDSKEVSAADYGPVTVTEANWNVTADVTNKETTLENGNTVDFGTAQNDWGVVVDAAIYDPTTDRFIIANEINDPDITSGEDVKFPTGEISYTIG